MIGKLLPAAALSAALLFGVTGAQGAETVRLAHTANISHVHHEAAQQFAKNVAARTNGKYEIQVYPAGELGDQPALAEQITLGALDMASFRSGTWLCTTGASMP